MTELADFTIETLADVEALEAEAWENRISHRTVYDAICHWALREPARPAIRFLPTGGLDDEVQSWSYDAFALAIRRSANLFYARGIGRKDVVSFLVPPLPQSHYGLWGASVAGIASPINFLLEPAALVHIIKSSKSDILVAYDDDDGFGIWDKVEKIRGDLPQLETIFRIRRVGSTSASSKPDGVEDFDDAVDACNGTALDFDPEFDREDTAFLVHTGGTTGLPKLARVTHGAILFKSWSTSVMQGLKRDETLFGAAPLFHIGGVEPTSAVPFANGMCIVIPGTLGFRNRDLIENYWHYFKRFGITRLYGVPTSYTAIAKVPINNVDISSIRPRVAVGSAPLPAELAINLEKMTGVQLANLYGLTEAAAAISIAPPDGEVRHGSCGIRYPYVEIKIAELSEDRSSYTECPVNASGDIIIKGPCVSPGYWSEEHNKGLFTDDGFLITGDIGRQDADGYLWITGRSKDIIIRGGHNIDPQIVEEALYKHDAVQIAGAVGRPDDYAGELPVVYVQLKDGQAADADELQTFAKENVAERAAAPVAVTVIDTMPLTAIGKVDKRKLRLRAAKQHFSELLETALGGDSTLVRVETVERLETGLTVVLTVGDAKDRDEITRRLSAIMDSYNLACEIGDQDD